MKFNQKKIGIWGFGITGKTAVDYLRQQHAQLAVMDRRALKEEALFLNQYNIPFYYEDNLDTFFENNDAVFVSAGINHPACETYKDKIINELDLFCTDFKKTNNCSNWNGW